MKKILMNVNPWQTRIVVTRDGRIQNVYYFSKDDRPLERSFFKGVVTKVLPGIQTAFVNIGQERAGFLHISEVDRELALDRMTGSLEVDEAGNGKISSFKTPDIAKIFKEGEEILVQVSKEPVYEKGAKLTTCFTLPGRFLVLMPNIPRIAISKKIEDREERARLKEILREHLPDGMGAIIRTTCEGRSEKNILQDLRYLIESWHQIQKAFKKAKPEERIHEDLPLPLQIVRDHLDVDVESVIVDDKETQEKIYKFVKKFAPDHLFKVKYYRGPQALFEKYDVNKQIEQSLAVKVPLRSGGSIIIETTQAMTVVDVNTGSYTGKKDLEQTLLKTNMEAAEEVVRQLRLRNIGGLIVIDFIDMASPANRQKLFKYFEKMLKERDKFQSVVLKVSEFGLVQMTRKRSGKTLQQEIADTCKECKGRGFAKSIQTQSYALLNKLKEQLQASKVKEKVTVYINPKLFKYITTVAYDSILYLEKTYNCKIILSSNERLEPEQYEIITSQNS